MDNSYPFPVEVLQHIYNYISIEEKIFTMPRVSKLWHSICREDKNQLEEFARLVFSNRIKFCNYSDEQIRSIVLVAKNNDLISELKKANCNCLIGIKNFSTYQLPVRNLDPSKIFFLPCCIMDGYSDNFQIYYDSGNFTLSTKALKSSNFRIKVHFNIFRIRHVYQQRECFRSFSVEDFFVQKIKEKKLFWWSTLSDDITANKISALIEDALCLQIKMYVNYYSHINMSIISMIDDEISQKNEFDLSLFCNENGLILTSPNEKSDRTFCFILQKKVLSNKSPIIIWYSEDNISKKRLTCSSKDVFRWSVYSLTAHKFAEKLGIILG